MKRIAFFLLFNLCTATFLSAQGHLQETTPETSSDRRCQKCGAIAYSKLAMSCSECNSSLEDTTKATADSKYASLKIKLLYTGDKPNDLPKYAKLYLNSKYVANIEQTDIQARNSELDLKWNDGLGGLYTAIYDYSCGKVPPSVKCITIEMRFSRMGGLIKSNKKAKFDYVSFTGGKETAIEHYFNSAVTFTQHKRPEELTATKQSIIPELPKAKLRTGNGTIGLEISQ